MSRQTDLLGSSFSVYHARMESEETNYHLPPLTKDLLDSLMFSMEDQANSYYLDLETAYILPEHELTYIQDENPDISLERFLPIPDWQPADGFNLMEQFGNRVRNPLYRGRLLAALQSGKGVFRKFKDVLAEMPVLERKWFTFRDEQLKRVIITWYRKHEEAIHLIQLPEENEELTEDILLEDFTLEYYDGDITEEILMLIQELLDQLEEGSEEERIAVAVLTAHLQIDELDHFCLAKAQDGTLAAFIAYDYLADYLVEVPCFGVKAEYRNLGLFRLLFDSFSRQMARFHYKKVVITLTSSFLGLERLFNSYGAHPLSKQLILDTNTWNSSHPSSEEAYL